MIVLIWCWYCDSEAVMFVEWDDAKTKKENWCHWELRWGKETSRIKKLSENSKSSEFKLDVPVWTREGFYQKLFPGPFH